MMYCLEVDDGSHIWVYRWSADLDEIMREAKGVIENGYDVVIRYADEEDIREIEEMMPKEDE